MGEEPNNKGSAEPEPPAATAYAERHWRGQLSLPRSWWLNSVILFGLGANAISLIILMAIDLLFGRTSIFAIPAYGILVAFYVASYVWILVGTWRSARNYRGPRTWSMLARVGLVIIGALAFKRLIETMAFVIWSFR